jgi:hypothetical protein
MESSTNLVTLRVGSARDRAKLWQRARVLAEERGIMWGDQPCVSEILREALALGLDELEWRQAGDGRD